MILKYFLNLALQKISFFFSKMDERKQLTVLVSCLSSILTSALLLLQLQAILAQKILQQKNHLRHLQTKQFFQGTLHYQDTRQLKGG